MSKKARAKKQTASRGSSSPHVPMYPYLPQDMDMLTMAQKVLLSPEIPQGLRDGLQQMVCIDIQDVISAFFHQQERLAEMNFTPRYVSSFLYAHAPDFVYDSETGQKGKWGHQEICWGTQCIAIQLQPDSYIIAQEMMGLPEQQPRWFEQVHWMLTLGLFLEVPEGKRRRCVGPVAVGTVLLDATGSVVSNDLGTDQLTCRITHEEIEDVIYWYTGMRGEIGPAPNAHQRMLQILAEHFCQNIYLSLLGYAYLNVPGAQMLPKEIHPLTTADYISKQDGRTFTQNLSLRGEQLLLKLPAFQLQGVV